jgi:hypothetical protein
MFFPLVVLVAVLPGLYALSRWDLTPPGPWWGLRGLAVLNGLIVDQAPAAVGAGPESEAWAYRAVAWQPPLYAWLEAAGLAVSPSRTPLATVLPSYIAGALVVILAYLHGRIWRGPGLGLTVAVLTGFNRHLLVQMQQPSPITLGLAGTLLALLCYIRHLRPGPNSPRPWTWGGGIAWAILGGIALGLALLSVGGFGLICVPVVLLHQAYLGAESAPIERPSRWWRAWRNSPSLTAGALALLIGLALAAPWHIRMLAWYGRDFAAALLAPPDMSSPHDAGLLWRLINLAPATLPLGLFAALRVVRQALRADGDDQTTAGGAFSVIWLAVAALLPAVWPGGPRSAFDLFLLVPLNVLAGQTIADLAGRRIRVRTLTWLAPAAVLTFAWWASADLREAVAPLTRGRRPDSSTALGLHLGVDLLVAMILSARGLVRWARRRDDRQRLILGGFLCAVLTVTAAVGIREVRFRHRETKDLLVLRDVILRLHQDHPFTLVVVVGPEPIDAAAPVPSPGGRLRFILRSALPELPQVDLSRADDLMNLPAGQHLVILVGEQRLPYPLQSQLGLWAIHPGRTGVLDAFATAHDSRRARK